MDILQAMIDFGCYFTIGVEVLYSDYIKTIAKAVPDHLLLTETDNPGALKESLNKLISFMVRRPKEVPVVQAHHEQNQPLTVRPRLTRMQEVGR